MNGATKTIWKTVVFAGAMLGTAACGGGSKQPATTPAAADTATDGDTATPPDTADGADPCGGDPADPCADPCGGRPRGVSDEGDSGRGFILS